MISAPRFISVRTALGIPFVLSAKTSPPRLPNWQHLIGNVVVACRCIDIAALRRMRGPSITPSEIASLSCASIPSADPAPAYPPTQIAKKGRGAECLGKEDTDGRLDTVGNSHCAAGVSRKTRLRVKVRGNQARNQRSPTYHNNVIVFRRRDQAFHNCRDLRVFHNHGHLGLHWTSTVEQVCTVEHDLGTVPPPVSTTCKLPFPFGIFNRIPHGCELIVETCCRRSRQERKAEKYAA